MSRAIITIFIIFVVVLGAVVGAYFFFLTSDTGEAPVSLRNIFPFGGGGEERDVPPRSTPDSGDVEQDTDTAPLPQLRELHDSPVAGAVIFSEGEVEFIRFIERETGNVFEIREDERTPRRLTNTTVPRIQEAFFATPERVVARYLNEEGVVQTFVGTVEPPADGEEFGELTGTFLEPDIDTIAVRENAVFYTTRGGDGGYVQNFGSETARSVLPIPFSEWLPQWLSTTRVALTSKPSASVPGVLYVLNTESGSMDRLLANRPGLVTLVSPTGDRALFSESTGDAFSLSILDISENTTDTLALRTLADKCAWGEETVYCGVPSAPPSGAYPDVWYQGIVSLSDTIWSLNLGDSTTKLLAEPENMARTSIDVIRPLLAPDESFLTFMNKRDGTLWMLTIPAATTSPEERLDS